MVLTRAQRAQTKPTPPDSPAKLGALNKAPARRGAKAASKKTEPEEEKPATMKTARATKATLATKSATAKAAPTKTAKAATTKTATKTQDEDTKTPASRSTNSRPASRAQVSRPVSRAEAVIEDEDVKKPASRAAASRATATTKAAAAKASAATAKAAAKTTASRATGATRSTASKTAALKASTTKKAAPAAKTLRAAKAAKPEKPVEEVIQPETVEEPAELLNEAMPEPEKAEAELPQGALALETEQENEVHNDEQIEDQEVREAPPPVKIQVMTLSQATIASDNDSQAEVSTSPSKLPMAVSKLPIAIDIQHEIAPPASPTKLPVPSASALMPPPASPFKSSILSTSAGLGSVRKPPVSGALFNSPSKAATSMAPPAKPLTAASPVRMNTSVHDFATVLGSPRRPGSSGSDSSAASRASTPKRPHNDENALPFSAKRVRTSISMPTVGSPVRSQASSAGSPPSPTKSSMRSPEKRPNMSPKKVSWHQTPPRQLALQETTPPPRQPGILDGCVFFLDVNSLTGSNQNSLFAGLIEELGGQCVQQWTHNNMGITHVLFMNGEMRTLEKVLATNGEVFCVSLGWLLDCQRENIRIPESQPRYLIDLTHVPGHTPKPNRSALNTPMTSRSTGPISHTPAIPPPKWALPTTPSAPREPLGALSSSMLIKTPAFMASKIAQTPRPPPSVGLGAVDENGQEWDKENVSPISEATPLVQKTCPPKQFNKSIAAMARSTGIGATPLRNKFLASKRRRSFDGVGVQKPKGASALGSPPRKLALGSPKRQASPLKRSVALSQ